MNLFKKKYELSDFCVAYFSSIIKNKLTSEDFPENFTQEEIIRINKECSIFRYVLFYIFFKDYLTLRVRGIPNEVLEALREFPQVLLKTAFADAGYSKEEAWNEAYTINEVVSDYIKIIEGVPSNEYLKHGYLYLCQHCLKRCGFNLPQKREVGDNSPIKKEEGVFHIINELYQYNYDCFKRTVKNSNLCIEKRTPLFLGKVPPELVNAAMNEFSNVYFPAGNAINKMGQIITFNDKSKRMTSRIKLINGEVLFICAKFPRFASVAHIGSLNPIAIFLDRLTSKRTGVRTAGIIEQIWGFNSKDFPDISFWIYTMDMMFNLQEGRRSLLRAMVEAFLPCSSVSDVKSKILEREKYVQQKGLEYYKQWLEACAKKIVLWKSITHL